MIILNQNDKRSSVLIDKRIKESDCKYNFESLKIEFDEHITRRLFYRQTLRNNLQ